MAVPFRLNKVLFTGYVPKDIKFTDNTGRFSVGIDESYKKDDQWVNKTVWKNCKLYRNDNDRKESLLKTIKAGTYVYVEGRLEQWKDNDGKYVDEIFVETVRKIGETTVTGSESSDEAAADDYNYDNLD